MKYMTIKNVVIISQTNHFDSISYEIKLPNNDIMKLEHCVATYDFILIPLPIIVMMGFHSVIDKGKLTHEKAGFLHIYANRVDLLLIDEE